MSKRLKILLFCLIPFAVRAQVTPGGGAGAAQAPPQPPPTAIPITPSYVKNGYYGPTKTVVKFDPIDRIPIGNVPFDRNFIVRIYLNAPKEAPAEVYLVTHNSNQASSTTRLGYYLINRNDYDTGDTNLKLFPNAIDIVMPALLPNGRYSLKFVANTTDSIILQNTQQVFQLLYQNKATEAATLNTKFRTDHPNPNNPAIRELTDYYNQQNIKSIFDKYHGDLITASPDILSKINSINYIVDTNGANIYIFDKITTAGNLSTQQYTVEASSKLSIVADAGMIFTGFQKGFNTVTPYVGINYSFRPLDSDIPFSYLVHSHRISFLQRFSANLGLTLSTLAKANYRADIFNSYNIMVGFGYKFSHVISLTGGSLFYNNINPNPLLSKKTLGAAPYLGLSINLKIKDALGDIAKVFTYGK